MLQYSDCKKKRITLSAAEWLNSLPPPRFHPPVLANLPARTCTSLLCGRLTRPQSVTCAPVSCLASSDRASSARVRPYLIVLKLCVPAATGILCTFMCSVRPLSTVSMWVVINPSSHDNFMLVRATHSNEVATRHLAAQYAEASSRPSSVI